MQDSVRVQVESAVSQLCAIRAKEIPGTHWSRAIKALPEEPGFDFRIEARCVEVSAPKFLSLSPQEMIPFVDRILYAAEEYEKKRYEELAQHLTEVKARVLKDLTYLRRRLSPSDFSSFLSTFGD